MTKARNIADLLDANGDVKSASLDNVPAVDLTSLSASNLTSGTIPNARISLDANEIPSLDTAKITTGTLASARIDNTSLANVTALPFSAGTDWQSSIVTASTLTAVAGNGYWIDTTSNACTITLPASASVGDTIEFSDYLRTWGTNSITINQNSLNFQGATTPNPTYNTNGQSVRIVYSGATQGWIPTVDDDVTNEGVKAEGGTMSTSGLYTIHTFTSSGTFTANLSLTVDYLVVAGGGGGGINHGGGGGAGGFRTATGFSVAPTAYAITVGAGGAGNTGGTPTKGSEGQDSVFSTITSIGGGGGGASLVTAGNGGSGGGAGYSNSPGTGTAGQGNNGGNDSTSAPNYGTGGGGGASAVGGNGSSTVAGNGGAGTANSYSGSAVTYAGGGGGGSYDGGTPGSGGAGGGGDGYSMSGTATAGTANTGGGGGGAYSTTSGAGGSGIVIIRYLT